MIVDGYIDRSPSHVVGHAVDNLVRHLYQRCRPETTDTVIPVNSDFISDDGGVQPGCSFPDMKSSLSRHQSPH
jgi:hypothetical protein